MKRYKLSKEHRKKLSESHMGQRPWMKGRKHLDSTKEKIRDFYLGKTYEEIYGSSEKAERKRKKMSESMKKKWQDKNCGLHSEERSEKLRRKNLGKKHSNESKIKIGLAGIGRTPWNKGKKGEYKIWENKIPPTKGKPAWNSGIHKRYNTGRTHFKKGGLPWNWEGGKSFEPYTLDFTNKFKRAIRKRDNYECQLCRIHQEKLNYSLSVHHINYDKKLTIIQNCISLCRRCHTITNHNRNKWTTFFQSLLSDNYNYKFNQEQKIILDFMEVRS